MSGPKRRSGTQVLGFFAANDDQLSAWLNSQSADERAALAATMDAILGSPLPQFQERFIRLYVQYLVAGEETPEEDRLRSITRMLGYEYQRYYGMDTAELIEIVHCQLAEGEDDLEEAPEGLPVTPEAKWYPDPSGRHELRYWDGQLWTEHVADQGRQSTDRPVGSQPDAPNVSRPTRTVRFDAAPIDPRDVGHWPKGVPTSHLGRQNQECSECEMATPHDMWAAILGVNVGFKLPIGRKQSTAGKLGRRSQWATCSQCGDLSAIDDAAWEIVRAAMAN